jgi:hypothetical protein
VSPDEPAWWNLAALILVARGRIWRPNGYHTSTSPHRLLGAREACLELRFALHRADEAQWTRQPSPRGQTDITSFGLYVMRSTLSEQGRNQIIGVIHAERVRWLETTRY